MVDRPNWAGKFDSKGNEVIPVLPSDPAETVRQIAEYDGPTGVAATTSAAPVKADQRQRAIPATNEHGLPMEIAKEMHQSADGYGAQLATMQTSASRVLQELPSGFAAAFDTLSPSIQTKAYHLLRQFPHLGAYDLVDKVQATLTLSEMAEATKWVRGLKA